MLAVFVSLMVEPFHDDGGGADDDEVDDLMQQNVDFDVDVHYYELIIVHGYLLFLKEQLKTVLVDVDEIIMMDQMLQEIEQVVVVVAVDYEGDDDDYYFQKVQQVKQKDLDDQQHL